jgi:hypothetical protein
MEVHAHSHNAQGKKNWKHYFWEFLMLFLAVTLSFFVENQREHYIEHQRESQFINSLYNDIMADTLNIVRIIHSRTTKEKALDSLSKLMNSDSLKYHLRQVYSYAVSASRTLPYRFIPNDGTIQQLKNSGALRLIRKRVVVDSIAKYDVNVRTISGQWNVEENLIDHYRDVAAKIFDALVFDQMIDENSNYTGLPDSFPALQPYNKRELYEWNYRVYSINSINKANRRDLGLLLQQARNLLELLKKEYYLE